MYTRRKKADCVQKRKKGGKVRDGKKKETQGREKGEKGEST